ncbi:MAG: hypothetical protein HYS13_15390 [Planctomycetia bacterium]|nr:hypothetical protein [Planctomycetia bacterium]
MTKAVHELLLSFDALTKVEKHEAAAEIMRRAAELAPPDVADDELTAVADDLFRDLDSREAADAGP